MMGSMSMGLGMFGMILPWILIIIGVALLVWVAVRVIARLIKPTPSYQQHAKYGGNYTSKSNPATSNEALEILRARFARGEIDEEEFQRRKRQLVD